MSFLDKWKNERREDLNRKVDISPPREGEGKNAFRERLNDSKPKHFPGSREYTPEERKALDGEANRIESDRERERSRRV